MGVLPPGLLAGICLFVPLRTFNSTYHLAHRLVFKGLVFHQPPSDQEVLARLPPIVSGKLSTKDRRRLAKRVAGSENEIGIQLAQISQPVFSEHQRYKDFLSFVGVNLFVLTVWMAEQIWICHKTRNDVAQPDGTTVPVEWEGSVLCSAGLLIFAVAYNIYIGLSILIRAQSAAIVGAEANGTQAEGRVWRQIAMTIGIAAFLASFFIQSIGGRGISLSNGFLGSDGSQYRQYINQVAFNFLDGLHAAFTKDTSLEEQADRSWIPTKPESAANLHMEDYISLVAIKFWLGGICAAIAVSFIYSAWRFSKLLVAHLEENAEAWYDTTDEDTQRCTGKLSIAINTSWHVINLFSPLFVVALWIPSISYHPWMRLFASSSMDLESSWFAWRSFELFRTLCVIFFLLLRIAKLREFVQMFLLSSLTMIRSLPKSGTVDQHVALRIQRVLTSVFWYTPLLALQYVYPIVVSFIFLAALKLAEEWTPAGLVPSHASSNLGGWGVCSGWFGRGLSPYSVSLEIRRAFEAATANVSEPIPVVSTTVPLDADEFDGDLAAVEIEEPTQSLAAGASSSTLYSGGFIPPTHGNVLASGVGFLLWWSQFAWFVLTILCFSYLRLSRPRASTVAIRGVVEATEPASKSDTSTSSEASTLTQRKPVTTTAS